MRPRKNTTHLVNIVGSVPCPNPSETQNQLQSNQLDPISTQNYNAPAAESGSGPSSLTFAQEAGRRRSLRANQLDPLVVEYPQGTQKGKQNQVRFEAEQDIGQRTEIVQSTSPDPLAVPLPHEVLTTSVNVPSRPAPRSSLRRQNLPPEEIALPPPRTRRLITSDLLPSPSLPKAEPFVEPFEGTSSAFPAGPTLQHRRLSLRQQNIPVEHQEIQPTPYARRPVSSVPAPPLALPVLLAERLVESSVEVVRRRRSSRQQNLLAETLEVQPTRYQRRKSTLDSALQVQTEEAPLDEPIVEDFGPQSHLDDTAGPSGPVVLDTQHLSAPNEPSGVDPSPPLDFEATVQQQPFNRRTYSRRSSGTPAKPSALRERRRSSRFHPEIDIDQPLPDPIAEESAGQRLEAEPCSVSVAAETPPAPPTHRRRSSRFNTTDDLHLAPPLTAATLQPESSASTFQPGCQRRYTSPIKTRRSSRLSSTADTPLVTPALSIGGVDESTNDTAVKEEDQLDAELEVLEPELSETKVPPDIPHAPDPESPDPLNIISSPPTAPVGLQSLVPAFKLDPGTPAPKDPVGEHTPAPSSPLSLPPESELDLQRDLPDVAAEPTNPGESPGAEETDFTLPPSLIEQGKDYRALQAFSSSLTELPLSPAQSPAGVLHEDSIAQPENEEQHTSHEAYTPTTPISALVDEAHLEKSKEVFEPPPPPVATSKEPLDFGAEQQAEEPEQARFESPIPSEVDHVDAEPEEAPLEPQPIIEGRPPSSPSEQAPTELVEVVPPRLPGPVELEASEAVPPKPEAANNTLAVPLDPTLSNWEEQQNSLASPCNRTESAPGSPDSFRAHQLLSLARAEVRLPVKEPSSEELGPVPDQPIHSTESPEAPSQEDPPGSDTLNRVVLVVASDLSPILEETPSEAVDVPTPSVAFEPPTVSDTPEQARAVVEPDPVTPDTARRSGLRLARVDTWSPNAPASQSFGPPSVSSGLDLNIGSPSGPSRALQQTFGPSYLGSWHHDTFTRALKTPPKPSIRLLLNPDPPLFVPAPLADPVELIRPHPIIPQISITQPDDSSFEQSEPSIREDRHVPSDIEMSDASSDLSAAPNSPTSPKKMKRVAGESAEAGPSAPAASTGDPKVARPAKTSKGQKRKVSTTAEDAIGDILHGDSRPSKSPQKRSKETPLDAAPTQTPASTLLKLKFRVGVDKAQASPEKSNDPLPPTTIPPGGSEQAKPTKKKRQSTGGSQAAPAAPELSPGRHPPVERQPSAPLPVAKGNKKKGKAGQAPQPPSSLDVPLVDSARGTGVPSSQPETVVASSSQRRFIPSKKKRSNRVVESDDEDGETVHDTREKVDDGMDIDPPVGPPGGLTPPATTEESREPVRSQGKRQTQGEAQAATEAAIRIKLVDGSRNTEDGYAPSGKKAAQAGEATGASGPSKKKPKHRKKEGGKGRQPATSDGPAPASSDAVPATTLDPSAPASTLEEPSPSSADKHPADSSKTKAKAKNEAARPDAATSRPVHPERKGRTATPQPGPSKEKPARDGQGTTPRPGSGKDVQPLSRVQKKDTVDPGSTTSKQDKGDGTPSTKPGPSTRPDLKGAKAVPKKPAPPPPKTNPIGPATSMSLLEQTLGWLQGGDSTPKREQAEKSIKKTVEKPKPSTYRWGIDYQPNAEERAELEANRAQREAERAKRQQWKVNAINLQESQDAYRYDETIPREIKTPHPMGILEHPAMGTADIIRRLWADQDADVEAEARAEGQRAAGGSANGVLGAGVS